MNRRQVLRSSIALAALAGAASVSIATQPGHALAYRPLTNNGDGDGGKTRSERKNGGRRRKRRGNGK